MEWHNRLDFISIFIKASMGFHLITKNIDGSINHYYKECFDDLCDVPNITTDSIIYQGEPHWAPVTIGAHETYKHLTQEWFRAGIKAQRLFAQQAIERKWVPEPLPQDAGSFAMYQNAATGRVKRGDYLIRSANAEIEVKCLTFYRGHIYLPYSHLKAHEGMFAITQTPVYFAIYERHGDSPDPQSLRMISAATVFQENNKSVGYDQVSKCLMVPLELTSAGFSILEKMHASGTGPSQASRV